MMAACLLAASPHRLVPEVIHKDRGQVTKRLEGLVDASRSTSGGESDTTPGPGRYVLHHTTAGVAETVHIEAGKVPVPQRAASDYNSPVTMPFVLLPRRNRRYRRLFVPALCRPGS